MNLPMVLAHGAIGSLDEVAIFALGLIIAGYLVVLLILDRRHQAKQPQTPPRDDFRLD